MQLPSYYLPRPPFTLDAPTREACDALLHESMGHPGTDLTGRIPVPAWQFCAYLADTHPILLHGSGNPAIDEFVPRQSIDTNPFGNRSAVFAASDGIWPMFFAIVDRERFPQISLLNSCFRVIDAAGERSDPFYFFSITDTARAVDPWRSGTIYILPRDTFEQHPPRDKGELMYEFQEWASLTPVRPYARLRITPDDFPLLHQIHGHNQELIITRSAADPAGWPWLDDL